MRGGRRRPASSPWAMMAPPTMRVDMPQLLWCTNTCAPGTSGDARRYIER